MTTTGPALAAGLWARPVCWDLPCPTEIQFMGGSMLLSWHLTPDDSDRLAYLSPSCGGMMKDSLRFAKPLPATTTLIAYAQYDNLVVIDAYRAVTYDCNAWCLAGPRREPLVARALVGIYTRDEHWPLPARLPAAFLINTAPGGDTGGNWAGVFLKDFWHAEFFNSYGTVPLESI